MRKFSCLYDKSNEDYKEKDSEKNAWREVENTLGYEEGTCWIINKAVLCWKGALLKTCSDKFCDGSIYKKVCDWDYLSIKMAITRKDAIHLKWIPSQFFSDLQNLKINSTIEKL